MPNEHLTNESHDYNTPESPDAEYSVFDTTPSEPKVGPFETLSTDSDVVRLLSEQWNEEAIDELVSALSGLLCEREVPEDHAKRLVLVVCDAVGNEAPSKRLEVVEEVYTARKNGECLGGYKALKNLIGGAPTDRLIEMLRLPAPGITIGPRGTDLSNAEVFEELHTGKILHHTALGWLYWDGKRWAQNEKAARKAAQELGSYYRRLIRAATSEKAAKQCQNVITKVESSRGIDFTLKEAAVLPRIDANAITFDAHPWLLNVENGTLDLRTGELRKHDPNDLITKLCPTVYLPDAECPRWFRFLNEITGGREDLIDYIQWMCAYMLTGWTGHHVFFIFYGEGRNGKGVFLRTLAFVLGLDYFMTVNPETLLRQRYSQHPTHIAALRGKRVAAASESNTGRRLDEGLIKALTGGDRQRARHLFKEEFEFQPEIKLILATNHRPVIEDTSLGMWERVRLIPFDAVFTRDKEGYDPHLFEALQEEREGILAWAVQRVRDVEQGEPPLPECVQQANQEYRKEQDIVCRFIDQKCVVDSSYEVSKDEMYEGFHAFANGKGMGKSQFGQQLKNLGYSEVRRGHEGTRYWSGIMLIKDWNGGTYEDADSADTSSI